MIFKDDKFFVETPRGVAPHGFLKDGKFCRRVKEKDRMKIFDAWSINPEVFTKLKELGIVNIHYKDEFKDYKISVEQAELKGFKKTFSGGETFYIPIKFWESKDKNQQTLL